MFIGMFLIWVVVIVGAVLLMKGLLNSPISQRQRDDLSPHDILAQRYARGEISKTEYDRMLSDLS